VEHSSWIREAERRNRIHPYHDAAAFDALRHFAFTFHDKIVEVLAGDFDTEVMVGSTATALLAMAERLPGEI